MNDRGERLRPTWRERYGHLPWHRRFEFLIPSLLICVVYFAFLVPSRKGITTLGWVGLSAVCLYLLVCVLNVLGDREKPLWLKNTLSVGIILLAVYLFLHFTNARWDKLGAYFFNLSVMSKGDPFSGGGSITNWQLLLSGLVSSVRIFLISAVISTILGLAVAIIRSIVNDKVLNFFLILYVDCMRSIPIMVMLIVVYSVLPYAGILLSPEVSGILTLSLVEAAFMSEVFRAGIQSIHHVLIDAAMTLGLNSWQTMRYVILPQALKIVLPPYTGYLVGLMKGTALCSQIAIIELLKAAYQIQSWYVNATPLILASAFYLISLIPLTRLSGALERKWKKAATRA
jgi:polar amino acid transport system permease protein